MACSRPTEPGAHANKDNGWWSALSPAESKRRRALLAAARASTGSGWARPQSTWGSCCQWLSFKRR
eukprot:7118701-Alexandrium_andersonii.AAC.1